MGQEIFYCFGCSNQLRSSDFDKRRGYRLGSEAVCSDCAPEALKSLPPEKSQLLAKAMAAARTEGSSPGKSGTGRIPLASPPPSDRSPRSGTGRIPLADPGASTRRVVASTSKSASPLPYLAGGAVIGLVVLVVALASSGKPAPVPAVPPAPSTDHGYVPRPPAPAPLPPSTAPAVESAVRAALQKAIAFEKENPAKHAEIIALYEDADRAARGSAFEADTRGQVDAARRRLADFVARELDALGRDVRGADLKKGFELLAEARKRAVPGDWSAGLDRLDRELNAKADAAYAPLRAQAVDAAAKKDEAALKALRERVAAWNLPRLSADLDRAVADAGRAPAPPPPAPPPPPPPPPAPVPATDIAVAWDAAMLRASGRDFAGAIQDLEKLGVPADVELMKAVAALHAEAAQALAKLAPGRKLVVWGHDFDRKPWKYEGAFERLHDGWVEFQSSKSGPASMIPLGFVHPRSFAALVPRAERRVTTAASLLEADLEGAEGPAPEKWVDWGKRHAAWRDEKANAEAERSAGYAFYDAWMGVGAPSRRADAALRARKLLEEQPTRIFTRRNRAMLQALADGARDFVFGPGAMHGAGMFRLEAGKTQAFWTAGADVDVSLRRQNFVEVEFSAVPDLAYRCWAYVGGCCAETLSVHVQGHDLMFEQAGAGAPVAAPPGGDVIVPVKHSMQSASRTHAGHRKAPARWGWIEVPLPKYGAAGAKSLRFVHHQQGFAVGWVVVSATREKAPADVELKEWDRALDRAVGPLGPTLDLLLWLRADVGVAHEGGKVATWADSATPGRAATQPQAAARPSLVPAGLGGKPVLRFDGAASHLNFDVPVNFRTSMTMTIVAVPAKDQKEYEAGNYAAIQWAEYGPWGAVFLGPQQSGVAWRYGTSQWGNITTWARPGGAGAGPLLVTVRKAGPVEQLYVQGALVHAFADRKVPIHHTGSAGTIGAGSDNPQAPLRYYTGDVAEIVVHGRALPDPERDALERLLRAKWGF